MFDGPWVTPCHRRGPQDQVITHAKRGTSGNISVSIEGIALEHFSELPQTEINSSTKPCPRHALFHHFLSDDSKKDSATTTEHSKRLIELLK